MKKIALGLVALAGFASLAACKSNQQTYRPAPNYSTPTYSGPTQPAPYSGPVYGQPTSPAAPRATTPPPAPRAACGGGKCG
jgi:hypothetical protein